MAVQDAVVRALLDRRAPMTAIRTYEPEWAARQAAGRALWIRAVAANLGISVAEAMKRWGSEAVRAAEFDRLTDGLSPYPAVRSTVLSAGDRAWVQAQLDKRREYIARIAEECGLDPEEGVRRWQAGTFSLPGSAVRG